MLANLRFTLRRFLKSPGFTATALATLAICLGANLVIYSVVDAILLRSLPFPEPERLMIVNNSYPKAGAAQSSSSIPNYYDRRKAIAAFASVSAYSEDSVIVGGEGAPARVAIGRITPEFFDTLGVKLARGKMFTDENLTFQTDWVAVLTDNFWRSYFNADPQVVGKTFLNDGLTITVVGVLPPGFRLLSSEAKFFRPASHDPRARQPWGRHSNGRQLIVRLAPGISVTEAQAQMDAFNAEQLKDDPAAEWVKGAGYRTYVLPLHAEHVRSVRPVLLLLQAGGVLLLLIGLINLGNLLLIRANGRAKELAVRQALGATAGHLARDVYMDSLWLALAGTILGLFVGEIGLGLLGQLGANHLPLGATIALDARVLVVVAGAVPLIALLLSIPVIWFNLSTRLSHGLQLESRGGTSSRSAQRVRQGFIIAQVAFAFVLLAGAALLGLSLKKALEIRPGFSPDPVLTGRISLPWNSYRTDEARDDFLKRLLPSIRALPGVTHVAISTGVPFSGGIGNNTLTAEGGKLSLKDTLAHYNSVASPEYWPALGIPLLRGRFFTDADSEAKPGVCIVDQAFAEFYWPGQDPLGRRVGGGGGINEYASVIVGVVAEVKQSDLTEVAGHGAVYFPSRRAGGTPVRFILIVRTSLPPESLGPSVRKVLLAIDPGLPIEDLRPMQTRIDDSLVTRRSPAILVGIFAVSALLLASIGLYGVMAYAVAQRTREFGIRLALGAVAGDVLRLVFREGMWLATAGLAIGALASLLLTKYMASLLFEVKASDPVIYLGVAVILGLVAAIACLLPARRATKVDPMVALRAE